MYDCCMRLPHRMRQSQAAAFPCGRQTRATNTNWDPSYVIKFIEGSLELCLNDLCICKNINKNNPKMSSLDALLDIYLVQMMEEELWHDSITKIMYLNRGLVLERYKRKHQYWVHSIPKKRQHQCAYHNLIQELATTRPEKISQLFQNVLI